MQDLDVFMSHYLTISIRYGMIIKNNRPLRSDDYSLQIPTG
jgi:hypothetical protein